MNHCRRCLLPANVPGADLDRGRMCAFCRAYTPAARAHNEALSRAREADLETARHAAGSGARPLPGVLAERWIPETRPFPSSDTQSRAETEGFMRKALEPGGGAGLRP